MKEQKKYDTVKSLVDHGGNKRRAAIELGCTVRTVDRLAAGYRSEGKVFFSHGNKGRRPALAIPEKLRCDILGLYNTKYYDCSYELFAELLAKNEYIHVSVATVRNILVGEHVLSPRAWRRTRRRVRKELEEKKGTSASKREKARIERKLAAIEDAHPRKPRCANFGEELQMDASDHEWFGGFRSHLHAAIDDSTGLVVGAFFDTQETLFGYYNVFRQTLMGYGIPYRFRTDRRTVFEYKKSGADRIENDAFTQFSYACKQFGVHVSTTSIPQGKGRIERLFQTLQGRLPILLRMAGATSIEQANEFLKSYIPEFNAQFALDHNAIPSVFEKQPSDEKINLTLAVLAERSVDNGCCVKFSKRYYRPVDRDGLPQNFRKGTKGMVIKAFDGGLFFSVDDHVFALDEVPRHRAASLEFSPPKELQAPKKRYIPPASHPWRTDAFHKFSQEQQHRQDAAAS